MYYAFTLFSMTSYSFTRLCMLLLAVSATAAMHATARPNECTSTIRLVTGASGSAPLSITIQGQVTSQDTREVLPGVSVLVKGTSQGTNTDSDGNYRISVENEQAVLVFSFVGYQKQEVVVGNRSTVSVQLVAGDQTLNEVVVVGYGVQKKRELTNSIASISSREIQNQIVNNPLNALAGQLPGVQITSQSGRLGANPVVRVRGTGSINAGNKPLYVLDGIPLADDGAINAISPADIETIDVLKDAAAAAIYGSRGGNGVVLITTKKGKAGRARVDVQYYTGIQQVSKKIDLLNAAEQIELVKENVNNGWVLAGGNPNVPNGSRSIPGNNLIFNYPLILDGPLSALPDTDWQDLIYRNAPISNYQVSISGGSERMRYYISTNYFDQKGIVRSTDFKRYTARANIDAEVSAKFRVGIGVSPTYTKENLRTVDGHWANQGIVNAALAMPPWIVGRYDNGLYGQIAGNSDLIGFGFNAAIPTPLQQIDDPKYVDTDDRLRLLSNGYAEFEPIKNLVLRTALNVDYRNGWTNYYRPSTVSINGNGVLTPGTPGNNVNLITSSHGENRNINYAWENTLTYNRQFNNHAITLLAGYSAQRAVTDVVNLSGPTGRFDNDLVPYITAASLINGSADKQEWTLLSYLGRVNYSYKSRYLLAAAIRRDGSSRFAINNKWTLFPSVSGAWRVSEEPFWKGLGSYVNEFKLRASYGITGNFNIGNYASLALLGKDNYNFGRGDGTLASGLAPTGLGNNNLTWETNKQTDVGVDLSLLNNRFSVSADYYYRLTNGLLYSRPVPSVTGFSTTLDNIGSVENQGFEVSLNAQLVNANKPGGLQWSVSANGSLNQNKIVALGEKNEPIINTIENTVVTRVEVGQPFGVFYGLQRNGVFMNQAQVDAGPKWYLGSKPGDTRFVDLNGDGKVDLNDRTYLGNPNPKYIYGFSTRLNWKNFDLDIQFQGAQGNTTALVTTRLVGTNQANTNNLGYTRDRWRSEAQPGDGVIPRTVPRGDQDGGNYQFSDRFLYDASYLRLRNLTLGYTLPVALTQRASLRSVRIYATGQNLLTLSQYIGYNPEANSYGGGEDVNRLGVDYGSYPLARSVVFGINFGF